MNFIESTGKWVMESSDEELTEFFAAFNKDEKEEFKDIIYLVNHFVMKKYPSDLWVHKYFELRGLIAKETDAGELEGVIDKIIAENQQVSDDLRAGKLAALGRLIGLVRKALPSSNPGEAKKILEQKFNLGTK